jgi:hypothetical protein
VRSGERKEKETADFPSTSFIATFNENFSHSCSQSVIGVNFASSCRHVSIHFSRNILLVLGALEQFELVVEDPQGIILIAARARPVSKTAAANDRFEFKR